MEPASNRRAPRAGHAQSAESVEVELRTLDEVRHRTQALRVLKVNVEGHEAEVSCGAMATLTDHNPIIMLEDLLGPRPWTHRLSPVDFLCERGYSLREFWNGAWHDVDAAHHDGKNLWAFPGSCQMPGGAIPREPSSDVSRP